MKSRPNRVVVLGLNYPPEPTGVAPYTGAMSRGLLGRGFSVSVFTAHPHYPRWAIFGGYGQWTRRENQDGVTVTRLRHYVPRIPRGKRRVLSEVTFGLRLWFARWHAADAIVLVSPALISSALAAERARLSHRHVPLIVWVQDLYSVGMRETGQGGQRAARIMHRLESRLLQRADRVIVIHERFAERVHTDFQIPREKIVVSRNWAHVRDEPTADVDGVRAALQWLPHETIVLHAGNMGAKQGLDNVIDAAKLVDDSDPPSCIRFVLMGDGLDRGRLEAKASGVRSLQFMAPVDSTKFAATLQAADVLLVNEKAGVAEMAVPSKLTSYFSSGRPVIAATDPSGTTAEEVLRAGAGAVVDASNPRALLAAIAAIASDREQAAALGSNGRRYRDSVLSEEAALDRIENILVSLALEPESASGPLDVSKHPRTP